MPPCKGDSGRRVQPFHATGTGTASLPRPPTRDLLGPTQVPMSHPSPPTHLQGVVEELSHTAEATCLLLLLLQPVQRILDVPFLNGHVGSGLPEGLEDKCCQPMSQRDIGGLGDGAGVCLVAGGALGLPVPGKMLLHSLPEPHRVPHQVLPVGSLFPKAL